MLITEFPFTLPIGFIDAQGDLHREGVMRRATARDEIEPVRDPRVQSNAAYLPVIVLSRVITQLGALSAVTPKVVEDLTVTDFDFLQELYNQVNAYEPDVMRCPHCRQEFRPEAAPPGERSATPPN